MKTMEASDPGLSGDVHSKLEVPSSYLRYRVLNLPRQHGKVQKELHLETERSYVLLQR
jgi:hypothetical protein